MPGIFTRLLFAALAAASAISSGGARGFEISEEQRRHWSFQPIAEVRPPPSAQNIENGVDAFLLEKLRERGLEFSAPASQETLIRRVKFDLLGLPPTPQEIDIFARDRSPHAYERLLDRFLELPQYGERWGRHWLDLARYAETDGFEHDAVRPHSWRYRDYVIRSFNEDKPYDRFIREQIAGDELWPGDPEALTATGFNLLGPDMVDSADQVQRRHNTLNDMTDTAALAFLGLTMGCARCHDHKFEPISQKDYFALQAFFTPAKFNREKAIPTAAEREAHERAIEEYQKHPKLVALAELEAPAREVLHERKLKALSAEAQMAHRTPETERNTEQANLVLETRDKLKVSEKELETELNAELKKERKTLLDQIIKLPKPAPMPRAMALENGRPMKTFLLHRGEYGEPRNEVAPNAPEVLGGCSAPAASRAELANWLASKNNPLTARVMVNRIWKHHFGRGLVETPSDFGTRGQAPTHPELLDWLAGEFMRGDWSIKRMHKLMMLSTAYRQSSNSANPAAQKVDPENQLYWRMNRLRLEGEVIRDSLLAISGRLNAEMGGPGVTPPLPKELFAGAAGWKASSEESDHHRRSIYIFARRNLRFPFLEVFDAPDSNLSCPTREQSTTAPQSLTLLNSDEVLAAARATAARLEQEDDSKQARIERAYRLVLGRAPSDPERKLAHEFLANSPLEELCRALFNLNEFVYVN